MKHKIESICINSSTNKWGVKIDNKIVIDDFKDYEAIAQAKQLNMLPEDLLEEILSNK